MHTVTLNTNYFKRFVGRIFFFFFKIHTNGIQPHLIRLLVKLVEVRINFFGYSDVRPFDLWNLTGYPVSFAGYPARKPVQNK